MTKLHDENFYTYQHDLLDESKVPDLSAAKPIPASRTCRDGLPVSRDLKH
jgi:hypothetical protein